MLHVIYEILFHYFYVITATVCLQVIVQTQSNLCIKFVKPEEHLLQISFDEAHEILDIGKLFNAQYST